jgi:hypothetical protein
MNKEAPRTEEWIDRHGRGVLLNHQECQTQHRNWSEPDQIQRKTTRRSLQTHPNPLEL